MRSYGFAYIKHYQQLNNFFKTDTDVRTEYKKERGGGEVKYQMKLMETCHKIFKFFRTLFDEKISRKFAQVEISHRKIRTG